MSNNLESTSMRDLLCASLDESDVGTQVSVCGWVAKRREHGEHLAFLDVRDHSGSSRRSWTARSTCAASTSCA